MNKDSKANELSRPVSNNDTATPFDPNSQPTESADPLTANAILDVIVIGAGWSGLGAATVLRDSRKRYTVLEARDYVGGRSRSVHLDGSVVELGSQWIQGACSANPIYKLAESYKAPLASSGVYDNGLWTDEYQATRRRRISNEECEQMTQTVFRDGWYFFQRHEQEHTETDVSLRATTDAFIERNKLNANDQLALEYLLDTKIAQEYAASLEDMSTWWWNEDESFRGGSAVLVDGYTSMIDSFAAMLRSNIQLGSVVKQIDWISNDVCTVTFDKDGATSTLRAHQVIVTVPLGVLQAKMIHFQPLLPAWKTLSIDRLGVALLNKLIMKWDCSVSLPWPAEVEWLERIVTPQGTWSEFYNHQPVTGEKVLIGFTAGREAHRVEQLSDDEILSEALQSLQSMFGVAIPEPFAFTITRWGQDDYSLGSYSFYKVGSEPKDRKNLGASLGGRLYFAGEACHLKYASTTHGALLSGMAVAKRAVETSPDTANEAYAASLMLCYSLVIQHVPRELAGDTCFNSLTEQFSKGD
ncbi:hypothetical protein MPSEU_000757300 [Mayamaea pseudoterrestris]|nr:hypothetical protein MPSEU_000757300 [Mayamaea pseudoterrestris]